ncbi:MAG: prephenate dehydratase [Chloroflexi bacterium]|nr:prephenate dehydratase [Chloroflexota bacterium]
MTRLAYLGPRGTNTEAAAVGYDPDAELRPVASVAAAIRAVHDDEADAAVCAIENSIEGSVRETVDQLLHADIGLEIVGETVLPIRHALVAAEGADPTAATVVYSHPQALAQCRESLARLAPGARPEAALSTAAAIESALAEPGALAVSTARAAAIYGAVVLADDIADEAGNETRFVVLAPHDHEPTGDDKTSIAFTTAADLPGTLVSVMLEFSSRGINLTHIESRPTRLALGTYVFLLDLQGHRTDAPVAEALAATEAQAEWLRVLGSYPRWTPSEA